MNKKNVPGNVNEKKTHSKLKINKGKREKFLCLLVREMALNFSF